MPLTVRLTRTEAMETIAAALIADFNASIGTNAPNEARDQIESGIRMNAELAADALVKAGALDEDPA